MDSTRLTDLPAELLDLVFGYVSPEFAHLVYSPRERAGTASHKTLQLHLIHKRTRIFRTHTSASTAVSSISC